MSLLASGLRDRFGALPKVVMGAREQGPNHGCSLGVVVKACPAEAAIAVVAHVLAQIEQGAMRHELNVDIVS